MFLPTLYAYGEVTSR